MAPAQKLRQKRVGEPCPDEAPEAMAFDDREGAGQGFDRPGAGVKLAKFRRQIGHRLAVTGVTKRLQHRGKVFFGQKVRRGPLCQPPPGEQQTAGGADVVAGLRQQHRIAQGSFGLDAACLLCSKRGGGERQPLPPGAGPFFLPTHDLIEQSDGGASGERDVLNIFFRKALRVGNSAAQPGRHRRRRHGRRGAGQQVMARRRECGAQNHQRQHGSQRRFWQP